VIRWEGDKGEAEISVRELVPGLYLVKVETGGLVLPRKVMVSR
jgi:hypothetical protein